MNAQFSLFSLGASQSKPSNISNSPPLRSTTHRSIGGVTFILEWRNRCGPAPAAVDSFGSVIQSVKTARARPNATTGVRTISIVFVSHDRIGRFLLMDDPEWHTHRPRNGSTSRRSHRAMCGEGHWALTTQIPTRNQHEPGYTRAMRSILKDLRLVLRLLINPGRLAETAATVSTLRTLILAGPPGAFVIVLFLIGPIAGAAEPYRDFPDYFRDIVRTVFYFMLIFGSMYLGALVCAALVLRCLVDYSRRTRLHIEAAFRVAAMAPIPLIPVTMIWFAFAAIRYAQHPNFQFYGIAKPAWLLTTPITVFGSPSWILVILAAWGALAIVAGRRIWRMDLTSNRLECEVCGYPLDDFPEPGCPECGAGRGNAA